LLENQSEEKVEFRIHHTLRNHKMSLLFTPKKGTIKPGNVKEIKVELVIKITTTIDEPVVLEAVGTQTIISVPPRFPYSRLPSFRQRACRSAHQEGIRAVHDARL